MFSRCGALAVGLESLESGTFESIRSLSRMWFNLLALIHTP